MTPESPFPSGPGKGGGVAASRATKPVISDYELIRLVGRGSYGDVWLARGLTGVYRAIKIIWRDRFTSAEPFEREFNGLKKFSAMTLPEASQLGLLHVGQNEAAGFFYYVMELADDVDTGREVNPAKFAPLTLKEVRARRGRLPAAECVTFGVGLARALAGLHERGLVHRDIKPSNIILVGGVPKLADIGLVAETSDMLTYVGTEGFVPPEGPGKAAADVFALGKLLYELATGIDREDYPRLPPELDKVPDRKLLFALNDIILRCCEPVPEQRYPDAMALLEDLLALQAGSSLRRRRTKAWLARAGVALAAAVIAAGTAIWWQTRPATPALLAAQPSLDFASAKSLAVLPLENLSGDPDNSYFTDGMHAAIIATLGRVAEMKVITRSSALAFKGSTERLAAIAKKLEVAYLLTGSVRRQGSRVRISLELRRASDEALLWSPQYERDVSDAFALQDDIADAVARQLQARERKGTSAGARFMTKSPAAYDLFLKASAPLDRKEPKRLEAHRGQIKLLEEALHLDPDFMPAAALLSKTHLILQGADPDRVNRVSEAAQAKLWAETASRLVPGGAGDGALSAYVSTVEHDHRRALALAEGEVRALPNEAMAHERVARALAALGRLAAAVEAQAHALALDPLNLVVRNNQISNLAYLRRPAEFEAAVAKYRTLAGDQAFEATIFYSRCKVSGVLPPTPDGLNPLLQSMWFALKRRFAEQIANDDAMLASGKYNDAMCHLWLSDKSDALRGLGRTAEAEEVGRAMLVLAEKLRARPDMERAEGELFMLDALARAGRADEAMTLGRRFVEAVSEADQPAERWDRELRLAYVCAILGRKMECLELLTKLIKVPFDITVPDLRANPLWDNVRAEPGFQALINDPKNSQPF